MHLGEEIFSCIFQLSTSLLILSKHRGEDVPDVHNKPQQMKVTYCRLSSTQFRKTQQPGGFGGSCMSIHQNHSSN